MVNINAKITMVITVILAFILVMIIVGDMSGQLTDSADNLSNFRGTNGTSTLPLQSLFSSGGVVMLVLMAGVLMLLVAIGLKFKK